MRYERLFAETTDFEVVMRSKLMMDSNDAPVDPYSLLDSIAKYAATNKTPIHVYDSIKDRDRDYTTGDGLTTISGNPIPSAKVVYFNGSDGTVWIGMTNDDRMICGYQKNLRVSTMLYGRTERDLSGEEKFIVTKVARLDIVKGEEV